MKTTSWDHTKAILHSIGTAINQGDIATKNYVDTKISETKEYVDTEVSGTEKYIDNKISEFVGNTPVADQIAEAKSNIPESSNSFEALVTNQDGEMKWEERTHYYAERSMEKKIVYDEESDYNIIDENGEITHYYIDGLWLSDGETYEAYDSFMLKNYGPYSFTIEDYHAIIPVNYDAGLTYVDVDVNIYCPEDDEQVIDGITFPMAGTYIEYPKKGFPYAGRIEIAIIQSPITVGKKLDEAFIPDTIARVEDIPVIEYFTPEDIDIMCAGYVAAEEVLF